MSEPVITVVQGETLRFRARVRNKQAGTPIDLSGAVITSQIRAGYMKCRAR